MSQPISILHFVACVAAVKAVRLLARAVWRVIPARGRLMEKGG